jgi:hypothetical protein
MSRRLRWGVPLSIIAVAAVVFVSVGLLGGRSRSRGQLLPDGTLLSFEAITYGREHRIVRGTWWQKLLNPLLTNELRNRFGMMFPRHQSASVNTLVFWTLRDLPALSGPGRVGSWEARGVAFDEAGNAGETVMRGLGDGAFYGTPLLETWELAAFPRRGQRVGVRLYTRPPGEAWVPAAEFLVFNPDPGPHPTWKPQPLPVTVRQGDTAFILTRFRTGVDGAGGPDPPSEVEAWTEATFRVTEKGKPTTAWEPVDVVVSDATGNTWKPPVCLYEWKDGEARLFFRGALWRSEPAWKLKVEFVPAAGEDESSLWTVRGAPVPAAGVFARSDARDARNGVTLRLMGISGEGARARAPVGSPASPETPAVHVRLSPPPQGMRLRLVRATDERGRPCALSRPQGGFVGNYNFRFLPPAGAKSLALSFAVHRQSRFVEFVAAPEAVGTLQ